MKTVYWWACQPLAAATVTGGASGTGGTTAITIQPGTPFDVTTSNKVAVNPTGLSTAEQAAVQSVTQLGTALPFVVSEPTFIGHMTAPQLAAVNANAGLKAQFTTIQGAATVNLNSPTVQAFLSAALAAGAISQATYTAMSTPQATIASP